MKKYLLFILWLNVTDVGLGQEVFHVQNGSTVTVQSGAQVWVQGGVTLDNGSLLVNNGTFTLKNNFTANQSDWRDNSVIGALGGTGVIVFNSDLLHQYWGATHFYTVRINTGGLTINNAFTVENQLNLIKGLITTSSNHVFLSNANTSSLLNDAGNAGYVRSWINGNFRRLVANNTSTYDFPVGNTARCNLLQFENHNLSGTTYVTASFGSKPGTDAGLNVTENGSVYTAVNSGGVWYLTPDAQPSSGNYALQLYFNGFSGLIDNQ